MNCEKGKNNTSGETLRRFAIDSTITQLNPSIAYTVDNVFIKTEMLNQHSLIHIIQCILVFARTQKAIDFLDV